MAKVSKWKESQRSTGSLKNGPLQGNRAGWFWCIKLELKWYIVQFPVLRWYLPLDRTERVTCKHFILTSVFRELWIWQDLLGKLEPILVLLVLVAFLQIKTWSYRSLNGTWNRRQPNARLRNETLLSHESRFSVHYQTGGFTWVLPRFAWTKRSLWVVE